LFISQSCRRFELRAKKNDAKSKKGTAGNPGNKTPSPANPTDKLPRNM
jgi:hypothetical protein